MVSGGVREHLKVIRRILVVGGHVETHETLKKLLRSFVIAKQCVSVDIVAAGTG